MTIPDLLLVCRVLLLMGAANGAPVLLARLIGPRFDAPLDGGRRWRDGRPLLGESKTWRGLAIAVVATAGVAALLGFGALTGAAFGAASIAGDALSSFLKRRRGLAVHAQAPGLDQVPEALLPMLLLAAPLGLSAADILVALVAFVVLALVLSRLLFRLGLRDRPY